MDPVRVQRKVLRVPLIDELICFLVARETVFVVFRGVSL